ncbi:MAG: threonine synthase, partial [Chloroflexi bacterium]|nr:threonine synthase [Chloroflexota bacterium]
MKTPNLICTKCKKTFPTDRFHPRCDICNEPLELEKVTAGRISKGNILTQTILERYAAFYPFLRIDKALSLHEGFTPLVASPELSSELGIKNILFKNESQNPAWSFKDRGTVTGIQHAISLGYKRIGTVSTGNMAVSVAAYGAKAGLKTFILVSANLPPEKLNPIAIYDPILIRVDGDYAKLYFDSLEIGKQNDIYFINSDIPFRVEGYKTTAFEICEQMNFEPPDYVVVPTSSGGNIRGILKGFEEFKLCGLIDKVPKMVCAQARGCSPIYNAYINNVEVISRVENPHTIAHAIENPYPPSGNEVLRKIRENGGTVIAVTDEEIIQAQKQMAGIGIFAQPASAVPLASVKRLKEQNVIGENDAVACIVTGAGLKDTTVLEKHNLRILDCKS